MRRPNLSRETKFSGANGDRKIFIVSVQLATSRSVQLTRVRDNSKHARTSAAASSVFGTIFRSSCLAVRLLFSSPRGHHTNTAMDTRPCQITGLHPHQLAMHPPRRCHHCPDLTDYLQRRLPRNRTGAFHSDTPRLYRHTMCLQASFRTRFRVIGV